ncbi:hypothetical protein [Pseudocnuella soli]|uniref:hypothetical protein n=1 Tax=Pseudocnuella soli TaxID=2502779 RepID=UPI00104C10EE|nr:hypothetical protein [Pseudocnuella soli]
MATADNNRGPNEDRNMASGRGEQHSSIPNDLPESDDDRRHLQPEETMINLPDVSDIPGQENVTVPRMESFADVTASSADEEGESVFGADDDRTAHTSMGQDEDQGDEAVEGTP